MTISLLFLQAFQSIERRCVIRVDSDCLFIRTNCLVRLTCRNKCIAEAVINVGRSRIGFRVQLKDLYRVRDTFFCKQVVPEPIQHRFALDVLTSRVGLGRSDLLDKIAKRRTV